MRRAGMSLPAEMVNQLRYGRGVDNRLFKAAGFHYRYTSRETVLRLRARLRLEPVTAGVANPYRYEPAGEEFVRHSPHVVREPGENVGREDAAMFDPAPPVDD